ncbi:MAG: aminotransferase class I/II-fold pyridoxal phosphate-dependent enzyme [Cellulosilyticaceae bacterium]
MKAPLYNALMEYSRKNYPFHMPGHKLGLFGDMSQLDLLKLDLTEADGLDNLYEATGIIYEAMELLRLYYGAKETMLLTNGSTAGILASLLMACKPGDAIIVARNCHHSVWHGMVLAGIRPVYLLPSYDETTGLLGEIKVDDVESVIEKYPNIKGMIMVSPTYEGIVSDIESISKSLHKRDKFLIVDEAHGAHFGISEYFPKSSLKCGADIVIHSMHKTMPTLTQSALIHLGTDKFNKDDLIAALRMVQTSSPSYLMMGVMDYTRAYVEENEQKIENEYIRPLKKIRKRLKMMKKLVLLENGFEYDFGKIIILTKNSGASGDDLAAYLKKHNIICEGVLPEGLIIMTTVADNEYQLNRLATLLIKYDDELLTRNEKLYTNSKIENDINTKIRNDEKYISANSNDSSEDAVVNIWGRLGITEGMSPREVYFSENEDVVLENCVGRIAKETVMLYPPGIPIICMGEIYKPMHLDIVRMWNEKLQGIMNIDNKIICKVTKLDLK